MKVYHTEIVPARPESTRKVCINRECDLCGVAAKSGDQWSSGWGDITDTKVTVKSEVGFGNSGDGGHSNVYEIDICPKCFEDRLVPWVNSLREGKPPIVSEHHEWRPPCSKHGKAVRMTMTDDAKTLADLKDLATFRLTLGDDGVRTCNNAAVLIERLTAENIAVEKDWDEIDGFMNNIDNTISEALEKIGEFPGKPAGFPDRVDVACRLLETIPQMRLEIASSKSTATCPCPRCCAERAVKACTQSEDY